MSKLIAVKIDLNKIDKEKHLYKGKKGLYLDLDVWINDTPDQYDNDASVSINQSKEQRENGESKVYVGNGKKLFGWGKSSEATSDPDVELDSDVF
jgi:hypothetical protein